MPTGHPFTARAPLHGLVAAANSTGAHIAAKLDAFASDERTLTDEVCDMLCIWLGGIPDWSLVDPAEMSLISALPHASLDVGLRKTTASEEARIGADLELAVNTPLGTKIALIQAKVFDATKASLRYDGKRDTEKLRKQLRDAKRAVGDLAFLMLFVPSSLLNGHTQGFTIWEQGLRSQNGSGTNSSKYGITLIPADALLNGRGGWHYPKRPVWRELVTTSGPWSISLADLLLLMLACKRGTWETSTTATTTRMDTESDDLRVPYRRLDLSITPTAGARFEDVVASVRRSLEERATGYDTF